MNKYEEPIIEIILFENEDVILTSGDVIPDMDTPANSMIEPFKLFG